MGLVISAQLINAAPECNKVGKKHNYVMDSKGQLKSRIRETRNPSTTVNSRTNIFSLTAADKGLVAKKDTFFL